MSSERFADKNATLCADVRTGAGGAGCSRSAVCACERMVREQIADRGVRDPRVLQAMRAVLRWHVQYKFSRKRPQKWGQGMGQGQSAASSEEDLRRLKGSDPRKLALASLLWKTTTAPEGWLSETFVDEKRGQRQPAVAKDGSEEASKEIAEGTGSIHQNQRLNSLSFLHTDPGSDSLVIIEKKLHGRTRRSWRSLQGQR